MMSPYFQSTDLPSKKRAATSFDGLTQPLPKRHCTRSSTEALGTTWRHLPTEIQEDIFSRVLHDRLVDAANISEKPAACECEHGRTYMPSLKSILRSLTLLALDAGKPTLLTWPLKNLRRKVIASQDDLENRMIPLVHTGRRLADLQAMHVYEEISMAFATHRRPLEFQHANLERILQATEIPRAGEMTNDNQSDCGAIEWFESRRRGSKEYGLEGCVRRHHGYWSFCSPQVIQRIAAAAAKRMDERDIFELFGEPLEEENADVWASSVPMSNSIYTCTLQLLSRNLLGYRERQGFPLP